MKEKQFFEKQTISSRIKASIVSEYFPSYCKIIVKKHTPKEIRYIDLFAGPGIYEDGKLSTPMLIAKQCQNNDFLRQTVKMIFNDNKYSSDLEDNFHHQFPEKTFSKKPHFGKSTVGEEKAISDFLMCNTHNGSKNDFPSLLFIDPFGYKGIETEILAKFLRNWGNEYESILKKEFIILLSNFKRRILMPLATTFST